MVGMYSKRPENLYPDQLKDAIRVACELLKERGLLPENELQLRELVDKVFLLLNTFKIDVAKQDLDRDPEIQAAMLLTVLAVFNNDNNPQLRFDLSILRLFKKELILDQDEKNYLRDKYDLTQKQLEELEKALAKINELQLQPEITHLLMQVLLAESKRLTEELNKDLTLTPKPKLQQDSEYEKELSDTIRTLNLGIDPRNPGSEARCVTMIPDGMETFAMPTGMTMTPGIVTPLERTAESNASLGGDYLGTEARMAELDEDLGVMTDALRNRLEGLGLLHVPLKPNGPY